MYIILLYDIFLDHFSILWAYRLMYINININKKLKFFENFYINNTYKEKLIFVI